MIGDRIKSLRVRKGFSITELADLAGVSKSYLSYIERNVQNNPSLQVLSKLAVPLESSIDYLLGENTTPRIKAEEILDEEWRTIIREAVDEGMSKGDFHALKDLVRSNKWKEANSMENIQLSKKKKSSNIIILHIDY